MNIEASSLKTVNLPEKAGSFALCHSGTRLLMALESTFAFYYFENSKLEFLKSDFKQVPGGRLNDGRCDRNSRFIVGGMKFVEEPEMECFSVTYSNEGL